MCSASSRQSDCDPRVEEGHQEGCCNPMSTIHSDVVEDVGTTQCLHVFQRKHLELVRWQRDFVVLCRCALFFLRRRPWHPVVYRAILWLQCESHSHQWNQRHTRLPPLPHREEARIMFQISTRFQRGRFVRLNG